MTITAVSKVRSKYMYACTLAVDKGSGGTVSFYCIEHIQFVGYKLIRSTVSAGRQGSKEYSLFVLQNCQQTSFISFPISETGNSIFRRSL